MKRYKHYISTLLSLAMGGTSGFTLQTYPLVDHQRTSLTISQNEQNRIAVLDDRIQQVFGAEGTFDVQSDDEGGQIFLKLFPESRSLKPTTITIITESGLTQDLRLIPKSVEFQSVLFKPHFLPQKENQRRTGSTEAPSHLKPIIKLLKAMVRNEALASYAKSSPEENHSCPIESLPVTDSLGTESKPTESITSKCSLAKSRPLRLFHSEKLKIEPLFVYTGKQFEGKVYTLTNQGSAPIHLKEQDFALKEDVAIHIPKTTLHPNEVTTLYVVSRLDPRTKNEPEDESSQGRVL